MNNKLTFLSAAVATALSAPAMAEQFSTEASTAPISVTVGEIQGESYSSPLLNKGEYESKETYQVTGIVTAVTTNSKQSQGFYIYSNDNNPLTSDGLFIKTSKFLPEDFVGSEVTVIGKVKEDYGLTLLTANSWTVNANASITPVAIDLEVIASDENDFKKTLERHEGMLINLPQDIDLSTEALDDMRVSRTFSYDYKGRKNNMVLAYKRPNMQPNQEHVAGSQASKDQAKQNSNYRLFVESDKNAPNGTIPYYPDFKNKASDYKQEDYIRVNDSVIGLEGVVHYSYGEYRLIATNTITKDNLKHNTPRSKYNDDPAPTLNDDTAEDAFAVRIATQNVLNYFNSPYGGSDNQHGSNRGAESRIEFEQQQAKLIEAIFGLNADIVGLMEIENNGFGDFGAINEFVNALMLNTIANIWMIQNLSITVTLLLVLTPMATRCLMN